MLLPGQDKPAPSVPISGPSWFVVSCGVRLSVCGLDEIRQMQVEHLDHQSKGLNFERERVF